MSTDPHLDFEVRRYKAIREAVLADNADDIDEQTLADTTEGLTNLHELLAAILRGAFEDKAMMDALDTLIEAMVTRRNRFDARLIRRRNIVCDAMVEAGLNKLTMPDFTASLRASQPHVVVVDENAIPQTFFEMRPVLRKRELLNELKDGKHIDGAELSNPGMTLTVRTR